MDERVRLRRGPGARLIGGFWLQPILSMAVVIVVGLQVFVTWLVGPSVLAGLPVTVALVAFWGFGVTAWAQADGDGLRWRYFRRYARTWPEIDQVRFGSATDQGTIGTDPAIYVRLDGAEHRILPAYGCAQRHLLPFAQGLADLAGDHGVHVETDASGWSRLSCVPRGTHIGPGRIVPRSTARLRLRLTGLAFLVVAGCALAGSFVGWQTPGTSERIVYGIIGVVLALVGVLLVLLPGQ